jgi:hypothetical protein
MDFKAKLEAFKKKRKAPPSSSSSTTHSLSTCTSNESKSVAEDHGIKGGIESANDKKKRKTTRLERTMFVHPTKNGGTAIEEFLAKHYSESFTGKGHQHTCTGT